MFTKMPGPVAPEEFLCLGTTSADGKRVEIFECKPKSQVKAVAANKLTECAGPVGVLSNWSDFADQCYEQLGILPTLTQSTQTITFSDGAAVAVTTQESTPDSGMFSVSWITEADGVVAVSSADNSTYYSYDGTVKSDCGLLVPANVSTQIFILYDRNVAILNQVTLSTSPTAIAEVRYYPLAPTISADPSSMSLACGESKSVTYTVNVKTTDTPFIGSININGTLSLSNPTSTPINLVSLSAIVKDQLPVSIALTPIILGIGEYQDFFYELSPPYNGSLTQNVKFIAELTINANGSNEAACMSALQKSLLSSVTATEVDSTSYHLELQLPNSPLEDLTITEPGLQSLSRTVTLGPYPSAGTYGETASAFVPYGVAVNPTTITTQVTVGSCVIYCVRTQGYWSQNASGPRYDAAWNLVGGPNAPFYLSNQTWLQVLNTSATSGTYYIAVYQFIPARLNSLKAGQPLPTAVKAAWDYLDAKFTQYTPLQMSKLSKTQQADIKAKAKILEDFNRGNVSGYPMCA